MTLAMKRVISVLVSGLAIAVAAVSSRAASPLPRDVPERQGVSSAALLEFVNALDREIDGMHSVMVVRHGRVIAEGWWKPYAAERNHVLYSLSKSFTSTALGFAVAEGRLSADDVVVDQFPDEPVAGTFGWTDEDTLTLKTCAFETPFHLTYTLEFEGDKVTLNSEANVSFGPTKQPGRVGRVE